MLKVLRFTFIAAGFALLGTAHTKAQGQVLDEIVAVVADKIVLKSDVDGLVATMIQQRGVRGDAAEYWGLALQQLIDQYVVAEIARRDTNIVVTDEQVDQSLDDRINAMTQQVGGRDRLEEIYGETIEQIRTELRDEFRDRLLADQLQNARVATIKITPTEVYEWFALFPTDSLPTLPDMIRASHIVRYPKIRPEAEEESLEIATSIRDSIITGTSTLEDLARRYSDDPGSADLGGRYEDMALGDLVPEFAAVASRLQVGEISEPFKSPFGYHVLRVNTRRGETIDFSHVLINIDQSRADPQAAIDYLNAVRDTLIAGEYSFELLARRNSEEEATAKIGGRVVDPSTGMRDLFVDALGPDWKRTTDTLAIGEISMPAEVILLDGSLAYHIVVVQRQVAEHRIDVETDYPRIEQLALDAKRAEEIGEWLDSLRKRVFIELRGAGLEHAKVSGSQVPD